MVRATQWSVVGLALLVAGDSLAVRVAPDEDHFYQSELHTTVSGAGEGRYVFTSGWHLRHVELWTRVFAELRDQPDLRYLEVGVFEGRSLLWMFENVLTHPSARATVIDVFAGDYEATFDANLAASGLGDRVTKLVGPSARELRKLDGAGFHIIYIDGSHTADDVLLDAALSWDLLAPGGFLVFDDYAWDGRRGATPLPDELRPQLAIDAFVTANRYALELVHRDYQLIVRKRDNPCAPKDYCSPVGQYNYFWRSRELWTPSGGRVALSHDEVELVERIARARPPGEVEIRLPDELRTEPGVAELLARLELAL